MLSKGIRGHARLRQHAHGFQLRVGFDDFLSHFPTDPGLFVASEGHSWIDHIVTVYPDGARLQTRNEVVFYIDRNAFMPPSARLRH